MVRKGISVNGKEIVARYVGDKKVWERQLIQSAHFENFNDWVTTGESTLVRNVFNYNTQADRHDYDYEAIKAKINGRFYDVKGARMNVLDRGSYLIYKFVITFKNRTDRDEVARLYQPDIYLYKRG